MPRLVDGLWLEQYVEPQLLEDFRNYNDDFIGVLKRPNKAAIDKDGIRFNKLINNVGFHVNKDSDFTAKPMGGKKTLVEYDKLDTDPTECTDKELRAMAFDKEAAIRVEHSNSFKIGVRDYVLHKLAPSKSASKIPVLETTGEAVEGGRKRLTYSDLITFYGKLQKLNMKDGNGWYMVLCDDHVMDLIEDRASTKNNRDIIINTKTGKVVRFYKIQFFENNDCPYYDTSGNLKSLGSVAAPTDQKASVFFYAPNTVYHIENVEVLKTDRKTDTRSKDPKNEIRLHSYGLCDKKQEHGFGAIYSGYQAPAPSN
ncbi:hypothetical protein [Tenacibaculum maritimum]|uniref:hypothetical protein n=1 Tax=Tenacibaculum maritimum TaxID=107401 RepID=UPI0012E4A6E6|nr:hypothetical protein [Tenacibaculum maritimum]CAA0222630.1 conserved hypothetical protein [Tenacibaculum maritimum]